MYSALELVNARYILDTDLLRRRVPSQTTRQGRFEADGQVSTPV
jgi:hypothetical protein